MYSLEARFTPSAVGVTISAQSVVAVAVVQSACSMISQCPLHIYLVSMVRILALGDSSSCFQCPGPMPVPSPRSFQRTLLASSSSRPAAVSSSRSLRSGIALSSSLDGLVDDLGRRLGFPVGIELRVVT